ncbi:hypothetical protein GOODEAATRI_001924 [Goodea atripinnis]|uniref:Uncharacterized protein n=1 Tax=Goodea atripinnis TaxID=208336 RepID=A0ABV0PUL5_9TELE
MTGKLILTVELVEERLRMRIAVLEESVKSCELECKASRETALMAELDQERKKTASSSATLDSLKVVERQIQTILTSVLVRFILKVGFFFVRIWHLSYFSYVFSLISTNECQTE